MNNATDLIAKLLANEDLTVVQSSVPTASFNIKTRVLTLPIWKDASQDLIGMLVGHEVGHALYTSDEYLSHDLINSEYAQAFQGYLNILEDVRIEKLMKRKYPGIRKTFITGYKELNDKDFFEVKSKDFTDMLLIDKINLYFKVGYNCGVKFNTAEKVFVDRAERTETIQQVIELAKEIFDYTKDELKEAMDKAEQEQDKFGAIQITVNGNLSDSEEDDDGEGSSNIPSIGSESLEELKDLLEAKTETAYQKKMEELADTNTEYRYVKTGKFEFDPFVSYKQVASIIRSQVQRKLDQGYDYYEMTDEKRKRVTDLKTNSVPVVNYLIKEFEMKKAATAYKRTTISRTGQLDMRKIYAYQIKDDLFKRISSVKTGKNHGMIFLLDWSGSMSGCIDQTLDQVINLAMFCRSAQIPFQVMAFTDSYATESYKNLNHSQMLYDETESRLDVNYSSLALLEFFNHKMTSSEFNLMVSNIKSYGKAIFSLSGTPLNQALDYMTTYVGKFKKQYNVEKLTFITLTDGQGETLQPENRNWYQGESYGKTYKNFLQDEVTGKSYELDKYHAETFTNAYLSMIKERFDATVLGFYLTNTGYDKLHRVLCDHYLIPMNVSVTIERMRKELKEKGYASLKGTGRDELFVVPLQNKIEEVNIDQIKTSGTSASIARQFGKMLNKRKTSRVLLSKFIDYVA